MIYRKDYTPNKTTKPTYNTTVGATGQSYQRTGAEQTARTSTGEIALLRYYESIKLVVKQLEVQNRQLSTEVEKLRYYKSFNENKYLQKINFEEEAAAQFQKEKNYQLYLLKIKHEEEMNKLRREHEIRIDELHRDIKSRDYSARESAEKVSYLELKNNEFKKELDSLEVELVKHRYNNSVLTEGLTKEYFANKKLEMLLDEMYRQKAYMETEIHVLLDIEAEKSRVINSLEVQLHNSENTERCLQEKLSMLTENFASLYEHIAMMKERLLNTELKCDELEKHLQNAYLNLQDKDRFLMYLKDRESKLRNELYQHQLRESRRYKYVTELMSENERLYRYLNLTRHKLHDICVAQGIDL